MLQGDNVFNGQIVALEPRIDSKTFVASSWPSCRFVSVHEGNVVLTNDTSKPIRVPRHDQVAQIRSSKSIEVHHASTSVPKKALSIPKGPFSRDVVIDPSDQLTPEWKSAFRDLHLSYDSVFEDVIGRYNDSSGRVRSRINISSAKPPTRKLRVPNYCKNNLDLLQEKFDEL